MCAVDKRMEVGYFAVLNLYMRKAEGDKGR